ncbi:16S rRNA (guanine(966)-N(2))-methyltransferase RsmD [Salimicrobium jeotgali]|uniref:16S rRNA (Guanine(966)-N(2))-methyltransferase RsmD n=1 Tax=Salimicrobium jeotgali TaxID=1230341 RepID=K2GC20_9BACI|nr:16S rRNA (guanine(966)-N(2))-methyltransferase RsmD [Salimicrobium jeotgali]AKG04666.1 16S rRNA (guanine(966)-N(2))-methyltransferase RsmD [Salimicrobium jeotgali]EKE31837.1 putative methyltransferase [Salimicrobium jeotgali]MBM7696200.1 16S rRNA (guanine966-N2)-methyltransferase [Salimicrobium jeotgali]
MRVISGSHKGQRLYSVPTHNTRPTTDKVKEAIFQIIGPYFDGGKVFDCFAGSGGLGIECLSRGAEEAVFIDKEPAAIKTIWDNLKSLKLEERSEVFKTDAYRAMKAAGKRGLTFSYVFLDPPYKKFSYEELLKNLQEYQLLEEKAIIVCEHDVSESLPQQVGSVFMFKQEEYGSNIGVAFYKKEG